MSQVIYHGSMNFFEQFLLSNAGRTDRASNGALGIWVTPDRKIAEGFRLGGGYLYEISIAPGRVRKFPLQWLMDLHDEAHDIERKNGEDAVVQFYDAIRRKLLHEGYVQIWIVEADGSAPTRVVLDPDLITVNFVNYLDQRVAA